mgnify:CR=1 FL=1
MTQHHDPPAAGEQSDDIKEIIHIGTKPLRQVANEDAYWLTITDAIHRTGVFDDGDVDDCSLRFIPEEYDDDLGSGLGLVPAPIYTGEAAQDGRHREMWRKVQTEHIESNRDEGESSIRSRVRIPSSVLDTLGYESNNRDEALIDIYAGTGVVAFGKPNTRMFTIPEVPAELR